MPANANDAATRLGRAVREYRTAHDLSQDDVKDAGGPSGPSQTDIENGRLENLTRLMAKKIDRGLGWGEGRARTIWNGGEELSANELEALRRIIGAAEVDAALRDRLLEVLDEERGA